MTTIKTVLVIKHIHPSHFSKWMWRMFSYIGIWKKSFSWIHHVWLQLLPQIVFVNCDNLFIDWSKLHGHGLKMLIKLSFKTNFNRASMIHLYSFFTLSMASLSYLSKKMASSPLGLIQIAYFSSKTLHASFHMKDQRPLTYFLGLWGPKIR